jgi:putative ABC transport system ATP-binding protein
MIGLPTMPPHPAPLSPATLAPVISLRQIGKVYRSADIETQALSQVTFDIAPGEFVAIMGPSGCGKSTLLNLIGLLDRPSSGQYWFAGENITDFTEARLSDLRKRQIGFIFQSFNLIDELTIEENIELALLYHELPTADRKQRVAEVMDRVGIAHRARHRPSQLSGGQQQRVAVARAVVAEPPVILADEPTGNLDSVQGEDVMRMLQSLNEKGTTVVMVTHSASHADYARRIISLLDGRVVTQSRRAA